MMKAMYSAVNGTRNHQIRMDVIGNNISNVNTIGFKASRVSFQEALNQILRGASKPSTNIGGVNPMQVGIGSKVRSIDIDITQGNLEPTGRLTDMAIQGSGYFVVSNGSGGYSYTRDGAFDIDGEGALTNPGSGWRVQGILADENGQFDTNYDDLSDIVIPIGKSMDAAQTRNIYYKGNLSAEADPGVVSWSTITVVHDSNGLEHEINLEFEKIDGESWAWTAKDEMGNIVSVDPSTGNVGAGRIVFDNYGRFKSQTGSLSLIFGRIEPTRSISFTGQLSNTGMGDSLGPFDIPSVFDSKGQSHGLRVSFTQVSDDQWEYDVFDGSGSSIFGGVPRSLTYNSITGKFINPSFTFDPDPANGVASQEITLDLSGVVMAASSSLTLGLVDGFYDPSGVNTPQSISMNFEELTQHGKNSSVGDSFQDGYEAGSLETFVVDQNGVVTGIYSNDQNRVIAKIVIASFTNPGGLIKDGSNLWIESANSGAPSIGAANEDGRGAVISGMVEMSNVDLAREFTDMIITQRGFQANTRVITSTDEMLQDLINLKR
jgi:flagellar hook protein FlgE